MVVVVVVVLVVVVVMAVPVVLIVVPGIFSNERSKIILITRLHYLRFAFGSGNGTVRLDEISYQ